MMEHNENVIEVPEDIRVNALSALERMMQYSDGFPANRKTAWSLWFKA